MKIANCAAKIATPAHAGIRWERTRTDGIVWSKTRMAAVAKWRNPGRRHGRVAGDDANAPIRSTPAAEAGEGDGQKNARPMCLRPTQQPTHTVPRMTASMTQIVGMPHRR
jgi:hypothetical protein